jgi:hypothetical protein
MLGGFIVAALVSAGALAGTYVNGGVRSEGVVIEDNLGNPVTSAGSALRTYLTRSDGTAISAGQSTGDGQPTTNFGLFVNAENWLFTGITWERQRNPVVFKPLNAVAVGTETAIWTPTAGKKFRLMGAVVSVGTAAGNVVLKDGTAGTTILVIPKGPLDTPIVLPAMGNGILSAAANNLLTATGAASATLSGYVFGTEE